jgi:hypothetical protein
MQLSINGWRCIVLMDNVSNLTDNPRGEMGQSTSGQNGEFVQLPITVGNSDGPRYTLSKASGVGDVQLS